VSVEWLSQVDILSMYVYVDMHYVHVHDERPRQLDCDLPLILGLEGLYGGVVTCKY